MRILAAILFFVCSAANAQFTQGQILTAGQLNAAFANVLSTSGGTLTGPLTVPALNVTGTTNFSNANITGGTITGLSAPIPLASGGTNANTATGATSQLQYLQGATGSIARSLTNKFSDALSLQDFCSASQMTSGISTCFANALSQIAATNQTLIAPPGSYLVNSGLSVSQAGFKMVCQAGAVFTKSSVVNVITLTGADQTIDGCEINGASNDGTGIIISSAATNAVLNNVYSHNNGIYNGSDVSGAAGAINSGTNTRVTNSLFFQNAAGGFENSGAAYVTLVNDVSNSNGAEGFTFDNGGVGGQMTGGSSFSNCQGAGGVGNIGIDTSNGLTLLGVSVYSPGAGCDPLGSGAGTFNITAENNIGNTVGLKIIGGYGAGATGADIRLRTNGSFATFSSEVQDFASTSTAGSVIADSGSTHIYVSMDDYIAAPVLSDSTDAYRLGGGALYTSPVTFSGGLAVTGGTLTGITGRLVGVQVLTSTQTYTPDTGTNSVVVELQAPGGGSGGTAATSTSQSAAASGGGAGSYVKARITSGFSGVTVTLPAGGAAAAAGNNSGTAGTTASFGSILSCPGGNAGAGSAASSSAAITSAAAIGSACTVSGATTLVSVPGSGSGTGLILVPGTASAGGHGGTSAMAPSVLQDKAGSGAGIGATAPGMGGGGANQAAASGSANAGAAGGNSEAIVWEYQ